MIGRLLSAALARWQRAGKRRLEGIMEPSKVDLPKSMQDSSRQFGFAARCTYARTQVHT